MAFAFVVALYTYISLAAALSKEGWRSQSIYQLLTDRYARTDGSETACDNLDNYCGGTWQGIINKLDYIQDMGFTAIWISPITEQIQGYTADGYAFHGFWPQKINQINTNFGSANDLLALSEALHERGMYLMVDVVTNDMAWQGRHDTVDYSIFDVFNDPTEYHPYCPIVDYQNSTQAELCWFGDDAVTNPDLKTEQQSVVDKWTAWISNITSFYNIDGYRLDACLEQDKQFYTPFETAADVFILCEVYNNPYDGVCDYQHYVSGLLNFPTWYQVVDAFSSTTSNAGEVCNAIVGMQENCVDVSLLGNFVENHDVPRFGSRTSDAMLDLNAIAVTMLNDGFPVIYAGEEQHYTGGYAPYNRETTWTSGYDTTNIYYQLIKMINELRTCMIEADESYLTSKAQPIYCEYAALAVKKGSSTSNQIVGVYNNFGANSGGSTISIAGTGWTAGQVIFEVYTQEIVTMNEDNTLPVHIDGGGPRMYYLMCAMQCPALGQPPASGTGCPQTSSTVTSSSVSSTSSAIVTSSTPLSSSIPDTTSVPASSTIETPTSSAPVSSTATSSPIPVSSTSSTEIPSTSPAVSSSPTSSVPDTTSIPSSTPEKPSPSTSSPPPPSTRSIPPSSPTTPTLPSSSSTTETLVHVTNHVTTSVTTTLPYVPPPLSSSSPSPSTSTTPSPPPSLQSSPPPNPPNTISTSPLPPPSSSTTQPQPAPSTPTAPVCPSLDGTSMIINGYEMAITCNICSSADTMSSIPGSDLGECMEYCANSTLSPACAAVAYSPSSGSSSGSGSGSASALAQSIAGFGSDSGSAGSGTGTGTGTTGSGTGSNMPAGMCHLKSSTGSVYKDDCHSDTGFVVSTPKGPGHVPDGCTWGNGSTVGGKPVCPVDNGMTFLEGGFAYVVACDTDLPAGGGGGGGTSGGGAGGSGGSGSSGAGGGSSSGTSVPGTDLQDCVAKCTSSSLSSSSPSSPSSSTPPSTNPATCAAVTFKDNTCHFKPTIGTIVHTPGTDTAFIVAENVGPSGVRHCSSPSSSGGAGPSVTPVKEQPKPSGKGIYSMTQGSEVVVYVPLNQSCTRTSTIF